MRNSSEIHSTLGLMRVLTPWKHKSAPDIRLKDRLGQASNWPGQDSNEVSPERYRDTNPLGHESSPRADHYVNISITA